MRTSSILDPLFPATRQKLLSVALLSPEKWWYLSELASHLKTSPSSLERELDSLTEGGILERKQDGRRIYYL
jgi:DNA-binding transcriptional ArsR family regulator